MHFVINPEYKKDYGPGYIFFSYNTSSLISAGIALFSRSEAKNGIPVSHCGVIINENECVEAANPGGVQVSNFMQKYVEPNEIVVFLCKPKEINLEISQKIIDEAMKNVGKSYATKGVIGSAIWNIFGLVSFGWLRKKRNIFNSKNSMYCSELCSESLIAGYPSRPGCLIYHPTNIYPATLFNDHEIFDNWNSDQVFKRKKAGRTVITTDLPDS